MPRPIVHLLLPEQSFSWSTEVSRTASESHAINSLFNAVSRYIKFFGGGKVRFADNAEGEAGLIQREASPQVSR